MRVGVLVAMAVLLAQPAAEERWAFILSGVGPADQDTRADGRMAVRAPNRVGRSLRLQGGQRPRLRRRNHQNGESGSAENVRKAFAEVRKQVGRDDLLVVVLLGHGTYDGDVAKFNLVGPDLTAADWATLRRRPQSPSSWSTPPKRASRFSSGCRAPTES